MQSGGCCCRCLCTFAQIKKQRICVLFHFGAAAAISHMSANSFDMCVCVCVQIIKVCMIFFLPRSKSVGLPLPGSVYIHLRRMIAYGQMCCVLLFSTCASSFDICAHFLRIRVSFKLKNVGLYVCAFLLLLLLLSPPLLFYYYIVVPTIFSVCVCVLYARSTFIRLYQH